MDQRINHVALPRFVSFPETPLLPLVNGPTNFELPRKRHISGDRLHRGLRYVMSDRTWIVSPSFFFFSSSIQLDFSLSFLKFLHFLSFLLRSNLIFSLFIYFLLHLLPLFFCSSFFFSWLHDKSSGLEYETKLLCLAEDDHFAPEWKTQPRRENTDEL